MPGVLQTTAGVLVGWKALFWIGVLLFALGGTHGARLADRLMAKLFFPSGGMWDRVDLVCRSLSF